MVNPSRYKQILNFEGFITAGGNPKPVVAAPTAVATVDWC
jgi:hypothetical protein